MYKRQCNQSIHQKEKQTLKTRSNNIWNYSSNPLNIKANSAYTIAYRAYEHEFIHCYSIRTIARKIERTRLIEIAYCNGSFKAPTLRDMIRMNHIGVYERKYK